MHRSLTDKAHQQIKDWIIRYHLKPGSLLNVKDLAQTLKMSQTPVREALSMLEQEHMIQRRPNKGFRVSSLNLQDVEDIYDLRITLEAMAAGQAARRMTRTGRMQLADILKEVGRLLKSGNKQRILELEQEFHMVIFEAGGNRPLAEMGRAILNRIWIIQNINILTTDHLSDAHPQHVKVFDALEKGDSQRAVILMKSHIRFAKAFVLSRLRSSDDILSKMMLGFPPAEKTEQ
ncbi:MAG: GntR family transcriptional regulator [Desulfobacteraceae bacterium]|nr:MAG: GntR family transcriptional regulator [Desulfobacteraceae bacterium]